MVPAYALTQGRTRPAGPALEWETLVTATEFATRHVAALQLEWHTIVTMCAQPLSVAEIGAALRVPIGVARVLVGDLAEAGYLSISAPIATDDHGRPERDILERLLHGLRSGRSA
jgi:hypothetical protein